jgi:hypothetical protein
VLDRSGAHSVEELRRLQQQFLPVACGPSSWSAMLAKASVNQALEDGRREGGEGGVLRVAATRQSPVYAGEATTGTRAHGSASEHFKARFKSTSTACTTAGGSSGVMCWAVCVAPTATCAGGAAQECVDTSNGYAVTDGSVMCPGSPMDTACIPMCLATTTGNTSTASTDEFCYGSGTSMVMTGFTSQVF